MRRINLILCLIVLTVGLSKAAEGNLQIINISPDTSMNLVSVSIEDSVIIDSLAFNEASAFLTVPEGINQTLTFTSINHPSEKYDLTGLTIETDAYHQSILTGMLNTISYSSNPEGIALDLTATWNTVNTDDVTGDTMIKVNFFHGISDMVELDINTIQMDKIVDNISYKEYSSTSTIFDNREAIDLFITSTDGENTIASRSIDFPSIAGKSLTIFFSGFTVPINNSDGPGINYYSVDEAGNVEALPLLSTTPVLNEFVQDFKNYPNPASGFTYLEFNASKISDINISLFDLSGKQIQSQIFEVQNGFNQLRISLPQLASGLYFLNLITDESLSSLPLVISQ